MTRNFDQLNQFPTLKATRTTVYTFNVLKEEKKKIFLIRESDPGGEQ